MTIKDGNDYRMKGKLYWWKTDWKRKGTGKLKPKLTQERKNKHSEVTTGDKENVGFRTSLRIFIF